MGWDTQDDNKDAKVKVNGAYDRKGSEPRTDILIVDKSSGQHKHVSVDQYGNITEHHDYR